MSADQQAYTRERIAKQLRQLMRVAEDNGILLTDTMPPLLGSGAR